jgi:hypothetical protein
VRQKESDDRQGDAQVSLESTTSRFSAFLHAEYSYSSPNENFDKFIMMTLAHHKKGAGTSPC